MASKEQAVRAVLEGARPHVVWDLGANTGAFSRFAAESGAYTVALDADLGAVDRHYEACRARGEARVLPLVMDLANPTAGLGWAHDERLSLVERGPADLVLALGLVHHLVLANQVPFVKVAEFLARLADTLVIEFVPRTDSQVQGMLSRMPRLDDSYSIEAFEHAFADTFDVVDIVPIAASERTLYTLRRRAVSRRATREAQGA
jgi:ribosomal protein L11 methylase PrmA